MHYIDTSVSTGLQHSKPSTMSQPQNKSTLPKLPKMAGQFSTKMIGNVSVLEVHSFALRAIAAGQEEARMLSESSKAAATESSEAAATEQQQRLRTSSSPSSSSAPPFPIQREHLATLPTNVPTYNDGPSKPCSPIALLGQSFADELADAYD